MTNLPSNISGRAAQRGMTLIEILVAIVVLSVGLLGMAGLQLKGMQVNQGSAYRWQAAMLAEDIADQMRADRANALASAYTVTLPGRLRVREAQERRRPSPTGQRVCRACCPAAGR